jgi:hypothetical protein
VGSVVSLVFVPLCNPRPKLSEVGVIILSRHFGVAQRHVQLWLVAELLLFVFALVTLLETVEVTTAEIVSWLVLVSQKESDANEANVGQ